MSGRRERAARCLALVALALGSALPVPAVAEAWAPWTAGVEPGSAGAHWLAAEASPALPWPTLPRAGFAWADPAGPADPVAPPPEPAWSRWLRDFAPLPPRSDRPPGGRSLGVLLLLGGATAAVHFAAEAPRNPRWSAGNDFDDEARDAFRARSRGSRDAAATASDVLLGSLAGGLLADWIFHDRYGAWESAFNDVTWYMGNEIATRTAKVSAGRERPYVDPCRFDASWVSSCDDGRGDNRSFFSAHASTSALLAGLLCARHLAPEDRGGWDWALCGTAASASVATGLLRMTADRHYLSDVLVGWASGALFGYVLPRVFDYRGTDGPFSRLAVAPLHRRDTWGLRIAMRF